MFSATEQAKLYIIKTQTLNGKAHEVSRADKQWVLNMLAREGITCKVEVLQLAAKNGYNVKNIPALL
jgi:hypothetical protein